MGPDSIFSAHAMPLVLELPPGLTGTAELVVGEQHTAPRIGSGRIRVLATPVMINLFEAAALVSPQELHHGGDSEAVTRFMRTFHDRCLERGYPPLDSLVVHVAGDRGGSGTCRASMGSAP